MVGNASSAARRGSVESRKRFSPRPPVRRGQYVPVAYAPWKVNTNRIRTDMWYSPVVGYKRSPMLTYNFWKYVDIQR